MIPVLWLAGPPGVGKTAVAWELYRRLQQAGADPAYVDVDQLGMCYPPHPADPDRHGLKARNVAALRANFAGRGARALIVSGVVDAQRGPDVDALGGPQVIVGRLRADADELRTRLRRRGGTSAQHEAAAIEEAQAFDRAAFADWILDTSELSIDEAAARVLREIGDWPPAGARSDPSPLVDGARAHPGGQILWVSGPTGVGKSTVGFRGYLDVLGAGAHAAYLDIGQIGFCGATPEDPSLRARNLAALWRNFHDAGARLAIVTGRVSTRAEARLYEQALPNATFSWRQLHVGEAELTRRILSRSEGGSWSEPGDPLRDRPGQELLEVAERAIAAGLREQNIGRRVGIDSLAVEDAAAMLLADWPASREG